MIIGTLKLSTYKGNMVYGTHNALSYIMDYALQLPKKLKTFFCEDERTQLYYAWVAYEQVSKTDKVASCYKSLVNSSKS